RGGAIPPRYSTQHLCAVEGGRAAGNGLGECLPGRQAPAARQPRQECGGPCGRTYLPGLPHQCGRAIVDSPRELATCSRAGATDHTSEPRRQPQPDDPRAERVSVRLGHVLPPSGGPPPAPEARSMDSTETPVCPSETAEAGQTHGRLATKPRCART